MLQYLNATHANEYIDMDFIIDRFLIKVIMDSDRSAGKQPYYWL